MGAWGRGIFSDDLAADVRDEFRERLKSDYDGELDPEEAPVFLLGLAATQPVGTMDVVLGAAAEGNPRVLIGAAVGLLIVLLSGPVARLVGRLNRSLSRSPASAVSPLLNKERQDARQDWLREGGDAEPVRWLLVLGGALFVILSALLFLGVLG